jgi:flagellin
MVAKATFNSNSLNTLRYIRINKSNINRSLERLASGRAINRGADNAAGLAIVEELKAESRALEQASRNIDHGVGMIQTAEGSMDEIGNLLGRAFELTVQASNGTYSSDQREMINHELQSVKAEIGRISGGAEFNGQKLLNGNLASSSASQVDIQAGTDSSAESRINMNVIEDMGTASLGIDGIDVSTIENALTSLGSIENAINTVSQSRAQIGALQNRFGSASETVGVRLENLKASESRIGDTDYAQETTALNKNFHLYNASIKTLSVGLVHRNSSGSILDILL